MVIKIIEHSFDAFKELSLYQETLIKEKYGACCNFIGTMRNFNEGNDVTAMYLEHYPGMTEQQLQKLTDQAEQEFSVKALIIHRVGNILPGENIVITAAWSAHRKQSFEACRFLIEELKHNAPFWKKETLTNGSTRWVETNTLL